MSKAQRGCYAAVFVAATIATGCTGGIIERPAPPGRAYEGACLCARCWHDQFCLIPEPAPGEPDWERPIIVEGRPTCRDPSHVLAQPTALLDIATGGPDLAQTVYCVDPDGDGPVRVPPPDRAPLPSSNLRDFAFLDVCEDIEDSARCDEPGLVVPPECPPAPDCTHDPSLFYHPVNRVCVAADADPRVTNTSAWYKLDQGCAQIYFRRGSSAFNVANRLLAEPVRTCFLSAAQPVVGGALVAPDGSPVFTSVAYCETLDPPHIAASSSELDLTPGSRGSGTRVRIRIPASGVDDTLNASGRLALTAPGCGPGLTCSGWVPLVDGTSLDSITIDGTTGRSVRLLNEDPVAVAIEPIDGSRSRIRATGSGTPFFVGAEIDGVGPRGVSMTTTPPASRSALEGVLDWSTRTFASTLTLQDDPSAPTVIVTVMLVGTVPNLSPTADAGPEIVAECSTPSGTPVTLSAAGSSDPDGPADITGFVWRYSTSAGRREAFGREVTPHFPLGESDVRLTVTDSAYAASIDATTVTVVDTQGPEIRRVQVATDCLWPPDHRMHLFRLGTELVVNAVDACEGEPSPVRIVEVRSNQPADSAGDGAFEPDVRFGTGAFCVRAERRGTTLDPREYTVVLEALDSSGHASRHELVVRVPHDLRVPRSCDGSAPAPVVSEDDPRCELPAPITGRSDIMVGGCAAAGAREPDSLGLLVFALVVALLRRGRRT